MRPMVPYMRSPSWPAFPPSVALSCTQEKTLMKGDPLELSQAALVQQGDNEAGDFASMKTRVLLLLLPLACALTACPAPHTISVKRTPPVTAQSPPRTGGPLPKRCVGVSSVAAAER